MKTIYKYPLDITDVQQIYLRDGAKPLSVGFDGNNKLCLWAQIDTEAREMVCSIFIVGTGNSIPIVDSLVFIGSVIDKVTNPRATFVWHIYY